MRTTSVAIALLLTITCFGCNTGDPPVKTPAENNGGTNNGGTNNGGTNNGGTNNGGTNNGGTNNGGTNNGGTPGSLDLLMVIDNSGSMCRYQKILSQSIDDLLLELSTTGTDFQIGVTTTHMVEDNMLEPLAMPGQLQSTPQAIPGFDRRCHMAIDANGDLIDGDFTPIRDALATAVSCMEVPDPDAFLWTDADIECALYSQPQNCSIAGVCNGDCSPADLFPTPDQYRSIPKVLESEDYRFADGSVDLQKLGADLACTTLVGTRGFGIEEGLAAAAKAVSLDLTGGAKGSASADTSAPNHGLIRADAKFGVMFVTDENDCSHDGTLDVTTTCGGAVCEFANKEGAANSPLLELTTLKQNLLANLADTRGVSSVAEEDVFVASLHGSPDRYDGEVPQPDQCTSCTAGSCPQGMVCTDPAGVSGRCVVAPSCTPETGEVFSGDRYDRFLAEFPSDNVFPTAEAGGERMGWLCEGDFSPALPAIGQALSDFASR